MRHGIGFPSQVDRRPSCMATPRPAEETKVAFNSEGISSNARGAPCSISLRCVLHTLCVTLSNMRKAQSPPPILAIRLLPDQRIALERAAQADDRPVSTLARKIITDWLREQQQAKRA
jgi:hypothetical protein